jgi:hypothetical protein
VARVTDVLLHAPGVQGVDERLAAGVPALPMLQVHFDPAATTEAAAEHGLLIDPSNHLPVAVTVLGSGQDPVAFVRRAVAAHEAAHGHAAGAFGT